MIFLISTSWPDGMLNFPRLWLRLLCMFHVMICHVRFGTFIMWCLFTHIPVFPFPWLLVSSGFTAWIKLKARPWLHVEVLLRNRLCFTNGWHRLIMHSCLIVCHGYRVFLKTIPHTGIISSFYITSLCLFCRKRVWVSWFMGCRWKRRRLCWVTSSRISLTNEVCGGYWEFFRRISLVLGVFW